MSMRTVVTVPFLDLKTQSAEIADEVLPVWRQQFLDAAFIGGPEVAAFEQEFAAYIGTAHAIGVANGTDALELAFRAVGIGAGDEVIMPVNTFIATAEAATRIGAVPVFVDCDAHLLIDPAAVEAAITPRTKAIVPVHLYGQTADLEAIDAIADRHGLIVIEDAAQSQGASSTYGRAGALARVAATSFYPGKNLGAGGDAGAVMTNDDEVADVRAQLRRARQHGQVRARPRGRQLASRRRAGRRAARQAAPPRRVERRAPRGRGPLRRAARRYPRRDAARHPPR